MTQEDIIKKINNEFLQFSNYKDTLSKNVGESISNLPDEVKQIISHNLPSLFSELFNIEEFYITGSIGKGRQTRTPWVAIMDRSITTTTQKGVYIVFLSSSDFSKFYISIGQGTTVEGIFGRRSGKRDIIEQREQIRQKLSLSNPLLNTDNQIEVADEKYKESIICSSLWSLDSVSDKIELIDLYKNLYKEYKDRCLDSNSESQDVFKKLVDKYKRIHAKNPINGYKELYKWNLITECQGLSNVDLIIKIAKKHGNLLSTYDASTLSRTIIADPANLENFSLVLDDLFNENVDLEERLQEFKKTQKDFWPEIVNLPNDNRSASVFLTCKYPQVYAFATWNTVYRSLCKYLGETERTDSVFLPHFIEMLQPLICLVSKDDELKTMIKESTPGCIQSDVLTAQTIVYTVLCKTQENNESEQASIDDATTMDKKDVKSRYWVYSPGPQASEWPRCKQLEIACIGFEDMGDLTQYADRDEMVAKLKEVYGKEDVSFMHDSLALWQFCHELNPGDVIFAKRGITELVGRGIVQGVYSYDENAEDYNHTVKVKWTHVGQWDSPFNLPLKTLTRFAETDERSMQLEALFSDKKVPVQKPFSISEVISAIKTTGLLYDPLLIKRFAFSLMSKPFVILSGLAGSGKTQLAVAFAKVMSESSAQYCIVSVGADWTNREPLLGFPNALQKNEYVRPENGVLQLLIDANENPEKPYFLILDEMNMSYVERYFADFLSVMESHGEIALWEKPEDSKDPTPDSIALPKNLFIIGTINVDETTYMFSPKVLDRANVIEFKISFEEMVTFLSEVGSVDTDRAKAQAADMAHSFVTLAANKDLESNKVIQESLAGFFKELKAVNAEFGYRSATEIFRFISQAKKNDDTGDKLTDEEILDCAIVQKLLPKLHGSRKKLNEPLNALWKLCMPKDNKDILIDPKLVETAIYKLSADKIARMYQSAQDNGFTSFAEA